MQETEYINVYGARVHNLKDISIRYLQKDSAAILKLFRLMPATFWAIWSVRM